MIHVWNLICSFKTRLYWAARMKNSPSPYFIFFVWLSSFHIFGLFSLWVEWSTKISAWKKSLFSNQFKVLYLDMGHITTVLRWKHPSQTSQMIYCHDFKQFWSLKFLQISGINQVGLVKAYPFIKWAAPIEPQSFSSLFSRSKIHVAWYVDSVLPTETFRWSNHHLNLLRCSICPFFEFL